MNGWWQMAIFDGGFAIAILLTLRYAPDGPRCLQKGRRRR